jgi:hypothetical protein
MKTIDTRKVNILSFAVIQCGHSQCIFASVLVDGDTGDDVSGVFP